MLKSQTLNVCFEPSFLWFQIETIGEENIKYFFSFLMFNLYSKV